MSPRRGQPGRFAARPLMVALCGLVFMLMMFAVEASPGAGVAGTKSQYIGAKKCKSCHRSEESGNQFGAWSEARHSMAWDTLAGDAAKDHAAALGIGNPQESERCLKCHVTAFGEDKSRFKGKHDPKLGVQCESCHGPGSEHMAARFAAASTLAEGEVLPEYTQVPDGEIISNPPMETCLGCHNEESPSFKAFCFYERVAKIRHLNPRKPRTAEDRAALLVCGCGDTCGCLHGCSHGECGVTPDSSSGG